MNNHIVGVFDSEHEAIRAIEDLKDLGYRAEEISVISKNKDEVRSVHDETGTKAPEGVTTGAATGGILGGMTGLLAGIGALAIPGIGPLIAAGPIAAALTGAAVGAGAGGLAGGLIGLGIPEYEAERYDSYVKEDKLLVLVDSDESRRPAVYDIFRKYGTLNSDTYDQYDLNAGVDRTNEFVGSDSVRSADSDIESDTLRLHEERLEVDKHRVETGEVRLHKEIIEEEQTINVPVQREEVVIERHRVTGGMDDGAMIGKDETIRIPVSEEQVEVTKRPVVTEEVSVGKRVMQETEQVQETVRKEKAELDSSGNPVIENEEQFSTSSRNRR